MRRCGLLHAALFTATLPMLASCGSLTGADELPSPIAAIRATAASTTEVMLVWPRMGLSPNGEIRVERGADGGAFLEIAVLAGDAGEYLDAGLSPSTRYRYRVRVCREVGCSMYTQALVTTPAALEASRAAPGAPR